LRIGGEGGINIKDKLIRYSMQVAMLKQLVSLMLITDQEFQLIKNQLMKDYKIVSDFTS